MTAAPVPGSATQFSYVAGDAATVVLDSAGGTLRVVTFAPHPGWFTVRLDQPTATDMQVLLESTSGQVRFLASLVDGNVVTSLEAGAGPGSSVPGNSAPGNSAPANSAPGGTGPDNSAPGNTAPGGDDNGGGDGGSGGGGGSGGDDSGGSGGGGSDD